MNGRVNGEKFVSKEIMVILCTLWHFYEKSSRKGDFSSHYYFSKGSSWMKVFPFMMKMMMMRHDYILVRND